MTPGARVAAAIAVIDAWAAGGPEGEGLDRVLADWGRRNRYAGSGDRRAVADLVYDAVRRLRSSLWLAGAGPAELPPARPAPPGRPALIGSLRLDGADVASLFSGEGHAPARLCAEEAAPVPLDAAPRGVRVDLPDWLLEQDRLGALPDGVLDAMRHRAPLHLRANALRADRGAACAALAEDGIAVEDGPLGRHCLTVTEGARRLRASRAFRAGLVEIQDAASQAVADLCVARPGMRVLDLCAGGGGKALALAAAAGNRADIVAHDVDPGRLAQLGPRAVRAGARIRAEPNARALPRENDLVLVDAPCSGSGAWARNPDAKWRLTEARLAALVRTQGAVLDRAAGLTAPGGRIVYATCSMMPVENRAVVTAFLGRQRGFAEDGTRSWTPLDGGDGFFASILVRAR